MNAAYNLYIYVLLVAALIAAMVGYMAWKRRDSKGAVQLVVLMSAMFIWCLFQALTVMQDNFALKVILANIRYFGIEVAPMSFYALAYGYADRNRELSLRRWLLIMVFPFVNIIAVWSNPLHHKFYLKVIALNQNLYMQNGPLYWMNMAYLYIFVLIGFYKFVKAYINSESIYKMQALIIVVAAFFPILSNIIFNFNILPIGNMDITSLSFVISGVLYFYALFKLRLLDIVPVARERVVEEMMDMVIVVDNHKRVLDLNKKAREMILRDDDKDYVGKNIFSLLEGWKELATALIQAEDKSLKIECVDKGAVRYYDLSITDIYNDKGIKSGELIVLSDITELEGALLEAQKAREQAEQANKAKGYFLANMSHEIRTPMNAVISIAEILDTMELSREEQKKYIKMIANSADSLLLIINDILDFSKIEAGKMELEKNAFDIIEVIKSTTEAFSVLAQNKNVKLSATFNKNIDRQLMGDPVRLKQILINLIGNAMKFTNEGSIEVAIKSLKSEAGRIILNIVVSDTGVGIPSDKLESIFESFKQADDSTARRFGGTGLGLSIVRSMVELMGGHVSVQSEVGKGSSFSCEIPFETLGNEEAGRAKEEQKIEEKKALKGLKVLVAEDNKINRQIISTYLANMGCEFELAENGIEAAQKFISQKHDVILMDVQMPEMDGLEASRTIREEETQRGGHVPIIALTAGAMEEDIENCLAAGMNEHLAKPIKKEKLYNALKLYFDKKICNDENKAIF